MAYSAADVGEQCESQKMPLTTESEESGPFLRAPTPVTPVGTTVLPGFLCQGKKHRGSCRVLSRALPSTTCHWGQPSMRPQPQLLSHWSALHPYV